MAVGVMACDHRHERRSAKSGRDITTGKHDALFGELIQSDPDNEDYWLHQANGYLGLAETDKAATNYEIVRRMGKATSATLNQLADIYVNDGTYKLAYEAYRDAAVADQVNENAPPIRAVDILISVGEYDHATALLEDIRKIKQNNFGEEDRFVR